MAIWYIALYFKRWNKAGQTGILYTKKNHANTYSFGAENIKPLASWLYDRGYKEHAVEVLVFCTELEPNVAQWYEHIGDVYIGWKKKEAITWLKKALAIDPSNTTLKQKITDLTAEK